MRNILVHQHRTPSPHALPANELRQGGKTMKKIMLVCNAGMSTGMLAKRIQEASEGTMEVHAYGEAEFINYMDGVDLILVGPQIRHQIPTIEAQVAVPVKAIAPQHYGMMDGKGVYKEIKKILKD